MTDPIDVVITEVHNVWGVYGTNPDGTEVDELISQPSRPQDWGDPRWHYERFRFDWNMGRYYYINHCHCWTDVTLERWQYPSFFALLIVQILMPGSKPQLCGRDYLAADDFWSEDWGEMPPYYDEDHEEGEEE